MRHGKTSSLAVAVAADWTHHLSGRVGVRPSQCGGQPLPKQHTCMLPRRPMRRQRVGWRVARGGASRKHGPALASQPDAGRTSRRGLRINGKSMLLWPRPRRRRLRCISATAVLVGCGAAGRASEAQEDAGIAWDEAARLSDACRSAAASRAATAAAAVEAECCAAVPPPPPRPMVLAAGTSLCSRCSSAARSTPRSASVASGGPSTRDG